MLIVIPFQAVVEYRLIAICTILKCTISKGHFLLDSADNLYFIFNFKSILFFFLFESYCPKVNIFVSDLLCNL